MNISDYNEFSSMLKRAGSDLTTAETHGLMSGLLCMGKTSDIPDILLTEIVSAEGFDDKPERSLLRQSLKDLCDITVGQINDSMLEFRLLLLDGQEPLSARVDALALWCQGFVYGLGLGGYKEPIDSSSDAVELIRDFTEIAKAGYHGEGDEEEESALIEVEEYVRVGALLILEELQPVKLQSPIVH